MDYYDILLAKKLNGGGGGGNQPIYHYKLGDDGFYDIKASIFIENGNIHIGDNSYRRSFFSYSGEKKIVDSTTSKTIWGNFYPIAIPSDATRVDVAITPNTQYVALNVYTLENESYTRTHDSGWQQGSYSYSINVGVDTHIVITCKYDNAGTSYPTEPSDFTIDFYSE